MRSEDPTGSLLRCVGLGEQQILLTGADGAAVRQVLSDALADLEGGRPVVRVAGDAGPGELHRLLAGALGVPVQVRTDPLALAQTMQARHAARAPTVLLVCDEADRLPPASVAYLASLQALTSLHLPVMQTVLAGSPELPTVLGIDPARHTACIGVGTATARSDPGGWLAPAPAPLPPPSRAAARSRGLARGALRVLLPASGALCVLGVAMLARVDSARPHRAATAPMPTPAVPAAPLPGAPVAAVAPVPTPAAPAPAVAAAPPVPGAWARLAGWADGATLRLQGTDLLLTVDLAAYESAAAIHAARDAVAGWLPTLPAPLPAAARAAAAPRPKAVARPATADHAAIGLRAPTPAVLVLSDATLPQVILRGGSAQARDLLQHAGFPVVVDRPDVWRQESIGFFFAPDRAGAVAVGRVLAPQFGALPLWVLRLPANPPPPGTIEVDLPP